MVDIPEIELRLNELYPEIRAKREVIGKLTDMHILRECHVAGSMIDARSLVVAAEIIREFENFYRMSDLDKDIWIDAIAGYMAKRIKGIQRTKRALH